MTSVVRIIASVFGVGYLPKAPGTWGSLLGVIIAWYFPSGTGFLLCGLSVLGLWVCAPARVAFGNDDPSPFVLDEVCGMLLSLLWLPKDPVVYGAAFLLFRLFDVWKPGPVRGLQNMPHPWSIMLDDLLAGVFANLLLQVLTRTVWHAV